MFHLIYSRSIKTENRDKHFRVNYSLHYLDSNSLTLRQALNGLEPSSLGLNKFYLPLFDEQYNFYLLNFNAKMSNKITNAKYFLTITPGQLV